MRNISDLFSLRPRRSTAIASKPTVAPIPREDRAAALADLRRRVAALEGRVALREANARAADAERLAHMLQTPFGRANPEAARMLATVKPPRLVRK